MSVEFILNRKGGGVPRRTIYLFIYLFMDALRFIYLFIYLWMHYVHTTEHTTSLLTCKNSNEQTIASGLIFQINCDAII